MANENENASRGVSGWNGSRKPGTIKVVRQDGGKVTPPMSPKVVRGLVAGLLVVVIGGLAALFLMTPETEVSVEKPKKEKPKVTTIVETTPAEAPKVEPPKDQYITNRHGQVVKKIEEKTYVDERGILRYEGGARVYDRSKPRKPIKAMQNDPFPKLKHRSDYEIATLITVQPGGMLFGSVKYDEKFKQSFIESLLDKNEPEEGDSDWDKDLKAAVEETKKELAARIKAGEDLETILTEAREESRRLASYKRDVQALIGETMRNPELTDEDVSDVIKAANKMLEEKGIEPFQENSFLRGRMRVMAADQRRSENLRQQQNQ